MTEPRNYRQRILTAMIQALEARKDVYAVWEGGSTATGSRDDFSDIDLCVLAQKPLGSVLDTIQASLDDFQVSHTWQAAKSFWGEGLMQRVIVLKDSPRHFSVDAGVFDKDHPELLKDFMEVERHGQPHIYFDKIGAIKPGHADSEALFKKQMTRVDEIASAFPIFRTLVLKEIERNHPIDAIAFFQMGLVRPMVEVLGMLYRPYKFDFGMRYLHKSFPPEMQRLVQELSYVGGMNELPAKIEKAEKAFAAAVTQVKARTQLIAPFSPVKS